jgi:hypothetical protein
MLTSYTSWNFIQKHACLNKNISENTINITVFHLILMQKSKCTHFDQKCFKCFERKTVAIGRVAYDNWLVMNANKRRHTTLDATRTLIALHQTTRKGDYEGRSHPNRIICVCDKIILTIFCK